MIGTQEARGGRIKDERLAGESFHTLNASASRAKGVEGQKSMGTEATPSPLSALGNALHLPSLFQPPPQGTGTGTGPAVRY